MVVIASMMTASTGLAQSSPVSEHNKPAELAKLFNNRDAFAEIMSEQEFERRILLPARSRVLIDIWNMVQKDSNRDTVRGNVIYYFVRSGLWDANARALVFKTGRDRSPDLRRLAMHVLVNRGERESRSDVLRFLDDPVESVRDATLQAIFFWPDSSAIAADYVRKNQRKKGRAQSLLRANTILKREQERIKKEGIR